MFEWHKKEAPFFTGITRGVGGFGFGREEAAAVVTASFSATGGTTILQPGLPSGTFDGAGDYKLHVFTSSGPNPFNVSSINISGLIQYLVVAGGGGGGGNNGGGGGGGGMRVNTLTIPSPGNYTVIVGSGGAGSPSGTGNTGDAGQPSSISGSYITTVTSIGGGAGVGGNNNKNPLAPHVNGGAGGGDSRNTFGRGGYGANPSTPAPNGGPYPIVQGADGGSTLSPAARGGGGGGGGSAGQTGNQTGNSGGGGSGIDWIPPSYGTPGPNGSLRYFAGGGGGAAELQPGPGAGGYGGGGRGATPENGGQDSQQPGTSNTGGGGGGDFNGSYTAGSGGSGIVAIRYKIA